MGDGLVGGRPVRPQERQRASHPQAAQRQHGDGLVAVDRLLVLGKAGQLRPRAERAQRLQARVPAVGESPGEGMLGQEAVERAIVVPSRDQADAAELRHRQQRAAERRAGRDGGVAQPGQLGRRRLRAKGAERGARADVGEVDGEDHDASGS